MDLEGRVFKRAVSRRSLLKAGAAGLLASQVALLEQLAWMPDRLAMAASGLPDIQHDIGNFIAPAFRRDGVLVRFGPVFTLFVPAKLRRNPTKSDRTLLVNALNTIESVHPFGPAGVFTFVSYGLPYFRRLPRRLVSSHMPQVTAFGTGPVLKEAVPSPTDVSPANPTIQKLRFNVPVQIESNDMLLTLRSDSLINLTEIIAWFQGNDILGGQHVEEPHLSGLIDLQTPRLMFQQIGLPRAVADAVGMPFARQINPASPMWMGFADQQVAASGPSAITTFLGNASAKLTNARSGDYFDHGSIQHLSHVIDDLVAFYELPAQDPAGKGEPFTERLQYMFRSNQRGTTNGMLSVGNADQFTNGGGGAFFDNTFQGVDDALANINVAGKTFDPVTGVGTFNGEHRMGHTAALQRSGRARDGTPIHVRMDGTGLDPMDVPDGSSQPKLQFTVFMPSADAFATMRANAAALDIISATGNLVADEDNGLERFTTATRRQNFLLPPRRHRSFPLLELT